MGTACCSSDNNTFDAQDQNTERRQADESVLRAERRRLLQLSKPELIRLCKQKDIEYSGSKQQMVDRLLQSPSIIKNEKRKKQNTNNKDSMEIGLIDDQDDALVIDQSKQLSNHNGDNYV